VGTGDPGTVGISDLRTLGSGDPGPMGPDDPGTVGSGDPGTVGPGEVTPGLGILVHWDCGYW